METLLLRWVRAVAAVALLTPFLHGAGAIYFNRVAPGAGFPELHRINSDGTGEVVIPVNLPSALNPTVSRDGRRLLVTSPDPGRPFKLSQNVYALDLTTGFVGRVTSYSDEYVLNGVRFQDDLARLFGNNTISSYKINFPYHKAFSPEGGRLVTMNLFKSGSVHLGVALDPTEVQASSGRFPIVDVYRFSDALPAGPYVFLAAQERDGFNQGGDGVDWHPALNEVVAAVASDISAVGTAGRTGLEGTVLAVFSTTSISPFLRKLTNPVGQADAFFNISTLISTVATPHDYAPAISADGTRVAYVRHVLRQDTRFDGAGIAPLPALCSIRMINYDGSGDHEVLRLNEGLWITRLAWAPDGSEIAFDLSPQAVINGWNSLLGDVSRSEIYAVNANGSNPRRVVAAPASYPTWSPINFTAGQATIPRFQVRRDGGDLLLAVSNLVPGRRFAVEGSVDLKSWREEYAQTASATDELVRVTPRAGNLAGFFRVRAF